jgi:riboflavin synthase alpha subunit
MFTGIVEEVGRISSHRAARRESAYHHCGNACSEQLKTGDSVAVSGVCLDRA